VNCKRKSRRRFFLLVRSRTPPVSSEFRGGGGLNTPNPPLGTPLRSVDEKRIFKGSGGRRGTGSFASRQVPLAVLLIKVTTLFCITFCRLCVSGIHHVPITKNTHCKFDDTFYSLYSHQHVSAASAAIFRVIL